MSLESQPSFGDENIQTREANAALSRALHHTVTRFVPGVEWPYRGKPLRYSSGGIVVRDNIVVVSGELTPSRTTAAVDLALVGEDLRLQRVPFFLITESFGMTEEPMPSLFIDGKKLDHPKAELEYAATLTAIVNFTRRRSTRVIEKRSK